MKKSIFEKFSDDHSWWSVVFSLVVFVSIFSLFIFVPELNSCLLSSGGLTIESMEVRYACLGWLLGWCFMYFGGFLVSLITCICDLFKKDPTAIKQ